MTRAALSGEQDAGISGKGAWKVVAATVTGRAHTARNLGNEDALHCTTLEDGTWLLALSDGAGSAAQAARGARLAVDEAVASLADRLAAEPEPSLALAVQAALGDVRRALAGRLHAARHEERIRARDLAATLLLVVVRGDTLAVLQLGDGAVIAGGANGWRRLTEPVRGDHAGETVFVTSRGAVRSAQVDELQLDGIEALALLSDGLEPVATDIASGEPHAPFFEPLVGFVRRDEPSELLSADLADFLASDRLRERTSDDLSLVVAVRSSG